MSNQKCNARRVEIPSHSTVHIYNNTQCTLGHPKAVTLSHPSLRSPKSGVGLAGRPRATAPRPLEDLVDAPALVLLTREALRA